MVHAVFFSCVLPALKIEYLTLFFSFGEWETRYI